MLKSMTTLRVIAFVMLLITGVGPGLSFEANGMQVRSQKNQDWHRVEILLEQANQQPSGEKRRALFLLAAMEFSSYINNHLRDKNSVEYVMAVFGLGVVWENSGNDAKAKAAYEVCDSNEMKNSPRALYNQKPLAPQLAIRLAAVKDRLKAEDKAELMIETHGGEGTSHDYGG
jgi:hypothetical protein